MNNDGSVDTVSVTEDFDEHDCVYCKSYLCTALTSAEVEAGDVSNFYTLDTPDGGMVTVNVRSDDEAFVRIEGPREPDGDYHTEYYTLELHELS